MELREYDVFSPTYDEKEFVLDDGTGPSEPTCLYALMHTRNKSTAVRLAVKRWRRKYGTNLPYCESDENPFKGVHAEAVGWR